MIRRTKKQQVVIGNISNCCQSHCWSRISCAWLENLFDNNIGSVSRLLYKEPVLLTC